ncbi:MAG: hypothetical protein ACYDCK_11280 [Thermoplasmatota archaeon]
MPRGVSDQFVKILEHERKRALKRIGLVVLAAILAEQMAELSDTPWFGAETRLYVGLFIVGIALGAAVAWLRARRYAESIKTGWNNWMRFSVSCTSVHELYRKARGKEPASAAWWGLAAAALLIANVGLFVWLWNDVVGAQPFAYAMSIVNALALGGLIGTAVWSFAWARRFMHALDELMREGTLSFWGER